MFLINSWYVAAWPAELNTEGVLARRILDRPVLLYRTDAGEPVALMDRCPHRLVPLSAGRRVGNQIRCGYHGMEFAPDGRCVHIPGQDKIPRNAAATAFPVEERYGCIWIWMGAVEAANPDLIPVLPWPELGNWTPTRGYLHIAADYRLLSDNLLDLSHEDYIHGGTIGNHEDEAISDYPVRVSVADGRVVRAHRDMPNILPPPFFRMMLGSDARIDRWQTAIWTAPSINMTDVGARSVDSPGETFVARVLHLLTPETATSSHYFWVHNRNFRLDDASLTNGIAEAHHRTFEEDKEMLELQQREIDDAGLSVPQIALKVDDAPMRARRILSTLIRREKEEARPQLVPAQMLIPDPQALRPVTA